MDAVTKLMEERAKYEEFLRELDKGGSSKPAHVVARVRADYTAKLQDVTEQLKANRDVLTRHADTLGEKLHELEAEEKQIVDEHAESELRKQVGELSQSEWDAMAKKAQAALMKVKQDQHATAADINRIRDIMAGVSAAEVVAKPPVDELAFLKSVVGQSTGPMATPPRASVAAQARKTVEAPRADQPAAPTDGRSKTPVSGARTVEAAAVPNPGEAPAVEAPPEKPAPPQKNKQIKCKSCGTGNPTNVWYCVKCGVELVLV